MEKWGWLGTHTVLQQYRHILEIPSYSKLCHFESKDGHFESHRLLLSFHVRMFYSEVNLVCKSVITFLTDTSQCTSWHTHFLFQGCALTLALLAINTRPPPSTLWDFSIFFLILRSGISSRWWDVYPLGGGGNNIGLSCIDLWVNRIPNCVDGEILPETTTIIPSHNSSFQNVISQACIFCQIRGLERDGSIIVSHLMRSTINVLHWKVQASSPDRAASPSPNTL